MSVRATQTTLLKWLKSSKWAFPVVLAVFFLVLTSLRINGSSVGVYNNFVNGQSAKDPDLIYGKPRIIRSDEWLFGTQLAVSQAKNNLPRVNPDLGTGRDVSLQAETPSSDWSTVFKPQNWSYFVLPLEYAFAFKWWLLLYVTIVSGYFFNLRLSGNKKLLSAVFSLAFGLSPFLLWWYQSAAFLSIAYGFIILLLAMRLINGDLLPWPRNQRLNRLIQVLLLGYVGSCFGLLLYPPFQIPIALVILFFGFGYILHRKFNLAASWSEILQRIGLILGGLIIAGIVGGAFIKTHPTPIDALSNTIYPGQRNVQGGSLSADYFFDGFLTPLLQSDRRGASFITNQSEDSNFILLLPFLFIPAIGVMIYDWRRKKPFDWILLFLVAGGGFLLLRAFTSIGDSFFKLLLLTKVQNYRLVIGMGLLGAILTIHLLVRISELKISVRKSLVLAAIYGALCFVFLMKLGIGITHNYPLFIHNLYLLAALAAGFSGLVALVVTGRKHLFALGFLVFTLASSFSIIPLYRGLGFVNNSALIQKMDIISRPNDRWATVRGAVYSDAQMYNSIAIAAGRVSVTGAQIYPDLSFWNKVAGPSYSDIYNREGHAIFIDDPTMTEPFRLFQQNYFFVKFECSDFVRQNIDFVLATYPLNPYDCTKLTDLVNYPNTTFYIYKVH